jgi:hypothetical protein
MWDRRVRGGQGLGRHVEMVGRAGRESKIEANGAWLELVIDSSGVIWFCFSGVGGVMQG